jgi:hypothetical protein
LLYFESFQMTINTNKFVSRMFRRINGLVWDITTGTVGLKTEQGIYSLKSTPSASDAAVLEHSISVNPFDDFGMAIPAFATQTAHADVEIGEIIVGDSGIIGWVVDKTAAAFKVLDHNGFQKTYAPPSVQILGSQGVLVVRNLFSLTGGASGAAGLASNLMPLLMLGGGDEKIEKILPLLLMTGQMGGATAGAAPAGGMNPLMLMMLMKDGGLGGVSGKMDPMMLMALSGGLGGAGGGMNPMVMMALMGGGDLFGGDAPKKATNLAPVRANNGVPVLNFGG